MMSSSGQTSLNKITLKGSSKIVSEFFYYGINSILYQRGIYPAEMFTREKKYGLTVLVCEDKKIEEYLKDNVCPQLTEWLERGVVTRLVVVIKDVESNEPLERWQFQIECDKQSGSCDLEAGARKTKDIAEINKEICAVIRQITATVTFLPLLESACAFDILFYTNNDVEVPSKLEESSAFLISDSEEVKLRSFSTSVHSVNGAVSYKFGV